MVEKEKDDDDVKLGDRWVKRINREINSPLHKKWREQAKMAEQSYRDERDDNLKSEFPIWWSTVEITKAAIFANPPKPDVRKRYNDQSKTEDRLAQSIERALSFTDDTTYFFDNGQLAVGDFVVAGCGQAKVELDTETQDAPIIDPISQQPMMDEDGKPLLQKVITKQTVKLRHFHWSKFGWEPGKDWDSCGWVYFTHDMTEDEIEEQFGLEDDQLALICGTSKEKQYQKTYDVYEVWDKKNKKQLFVAKGLDDPLEENDDPLKLANFFPCPKPMMTNIKSDAFVPKPDYCFIEKQCRNINRLSSRISNLTEQIKDIGFYDAQLGELSQLSSAEDGTLVPVKNLMERLNKTGKTDFDSVIAKQDNQGKAIVLRELIAQRDIEKNNVFETVGIADIVRGASQASETAAAQTIKAQWANVRIGPKIKSIAMFFRESFRLMSEVIAEHFTLEQLNRMAGMQLTEEEHQALKNDLSRQYAIDVETDSTLAADDAEERGQRLEMVKAMTDYLNVYLPLAQQKLIPAEMVKQTMLFVIRSFKYGRQLEESMQNLPDNVQQLQELQQQLQQCQQQLEQATQQSQQLQQQLGKIDQQKNMREDAKTQAEIQNDTALTGADVELKAAQTANTYKDALTPEPVSVTY